MEFQAGNTWKSKHIHCVCEAEIKKSNYILMFLPTKHSQNQVEYEVRADQDQRGEINPRPLHPDGIIYLGRKKYKKNNVGI